MILTYTHEHLKSFKIKDESGEELIVVVTTKDEAGRFWFKDYNGDILITSLDYIDEINMSSSSITLNSEYKQDLSDIFIFSNSSLKISGIKQIEPWSHETGYSVMRAQKWNSRPVITADLASGKTIRLGSFLASSLIFLITGSIFLSWL